MKRRLLAALIAISAPNLIPPALAETPSIPPLFRGEWRGDLKNCEHGHPDDLRLAITDKAVSFYESGGVVRAAVARGREVTLILEMSEEEDRHWIAPFQFKLSRDGKRLTDTTTLAGSKAVRYRCPNR